MKVLLAVLLCVSLCLTASAQPAEDQGRVQELETQLKSYAGENYCHTECLVLERMVHLKIPAALWPRMLDTNSQYSGGRRMAYLTGAILEYFDALGYKGLSDLGYNNQMGAVTAALDELGPKFSFTYVYLGPDDQTAWDTGLFYEGMLESLLGRYGGWQPKSGVAHITLTVDPKVKSPSATSDGSHFNVVVPSTVQVSSDEWQAKVQSVFDRYKKS